MISDSFVVHVPNKKSWLKINDILIEKGYSWDGASARKYWKVFGKNSCVCINHTTKKLMFSSRRYYASRESCIFTDKDFLFMYNNTHGVFGVFRVLTLRAVLKIKGRVMR